MASFLAHNRQMTIAVIVGFLLLLLPLGAVLLVFPALTTAQCEPQLTVQGVSTQDAGGTEQATFAPGETIRFVADVNNGYGGWLLGANGTWLAVTTSFYSTTDSVDIPPGISTWTWEATAPSTAGDYTVEVVVYDSFCGISGGLGTYFSVGEPEATPPPDEGGGTDLVANAGPDQTVPGPGPVAVQFDGSGSTGDIVRYQWYNQYGLLLAEEVAPVIEVNFGKNNPQPGTQRTFTLVVADSQGNTAQDQVTITLGETTEEETPPPEAEGEIDIVATGIDALAHPICAGAVTFRAFLHNNGSKESGPFDIRWIVDNSQTFDGGHPSEPAGADGSHDIPFTDLAAGEHTLEFVADSGDQIPETDEDNNSATLSFTAEDCSDTEPPTVSWLEPVGNGGVYPIVSGTVETIDLEASVTDNVGIELVEFSLWDTVSPEQTLLATFSAPPYQISVDANTLHMKWNQLTARVTDTAGNYSGQTMSIYRLDPAISLDVAKGPADTTVAMQGSGWFPGETVILNLGDPASKVGQVTVDDAGNFATTFTVPPTAAIGEQKVIASNTTTGWTWQAEATFLVTEPEETPTPAPTPTPPGAPDNLPLLNLVQNAVLLEDRLRLTADQENQTGAAWLPAKQSVQGGFEATFQWQISRSDPAVGGEGFAFVIHNADLPFPALALGEGRHGLGYQGIPNSLAVEFDTAQNPTADFGAGTLGDPNDNHISVQTRGTEPNNANTDFSLGFTIQGEPAIPLFADGSVHTAKVAYVPGTLTIFLDDLTRPVLAIPVDLGTTLSLDNGQAWIGFTAATGGRSQAYDILSFSFVTPTPPEPGRLRVITALSMSNTDLLVGENVTASFTVKNVGGSALHLEELAAGARRGSDWNSEVVDFPRVSNITLQPNEEYVYTQSHSFNTAGEYFAEPVKKINGKWGGIENANRVSFTVLKQRKVVVFLQGIGTDLTQKEIDKLKESCNDPFYGDEVFGAIKFALSTMNFECDDFLHYSYESGSVDQIGNREWHPKPYKCDKTGQPLAVSIVWLHSMLSEYRQKHAEIWEDVQFVLIGHSLGGVVALETTGSIGQDPELKDSIAAVVTIDSPLNHLSAKNREDLEKIAPPLAKLSCGYGGAGLLLDSTVAKELSDVTDANRQHIRKEKEELVSAAQKNGVKFMTIGNDDDCLWYLKHCGLARDFPAEERPGAPPTLPGEWIDDRPTMWIANTDYKSPYPQNRYPLGKLGCDLSGGLNIFKFQCLAAPHTIALQHIDLKEPGKSVVFDIAKFIGRNPTD